MNTNNKQEFKTAIFFYYSLEENIKHVNEWYDDIPESKQELLHGIEDGTLVKPVSFIVLHYPYSKEQRIFFKENQPATKHELYKRILETLPNYMNSHPYSAPHEVSDFVIETIEIVPFNDFYAYAYLSIGS